MRSTNTASPSKALAQNMPLHHHQLTKPQFNALSRDLLRSKLLQARNPRQCVLQYSTRHGNPAIYVFGLQYEDEKSARKRLKA